MNRRQKIIVSVTGIFLVLLLLVGLTYAYFLTRITGNTNDKSISVSTANLAIVYGNDDGSIIGSGEKITPGTTFEPKTFTVTNQGNTNTDYVVVIEEASVTYAETIEVDGTTQTAGTETTFESNDFTYTLTCESGCNSVQEPTTFPIEGGILVGNRLDVGETQTYSFTLTYNETGENQSNDMNKKLEAKINIKDITTINPYSDKPNTLAYNIINNAILRKNDTSLLNASVTKIAEEISSYKTGKLVKKTIDFASYEWIYAETFEELDTAVEEVSECTEDLIGKWLLENSGGSFDYYGTYIIQVVDCDGELPMYIAEEVIPEKTLSVAQDDYGISYYYRGNVEDNYVNFAEMCWKIVRIAGDGSIKLILEDKNTTCDDSETTLTSAIYRGIWNIDRGNYGMEPLDNDGLYGKINYLKPTKSSNKSMAKINYDFQNTNLKFYLDKLKSGDWCLADTAYERLGTSTYTYAELLSYDYSKEMYYEASTRLMGDSINKYNPTFKCNGKVLENFASVINEVDGAEIIKEEPMYVGALTADEVVYAGGSYGRENGRFYLTNKNKSFRLLTPGSYRNYYGDLAFVVEEYGVLNSTLIGGTPNIRPAISLKSGISIISGGDGTQENPYVISD